MKQDISRFLNESGQVYVWPKKHADKQLVLGFLVENFEFRVIYSEKDINRILNEWHTFKDWPLLRRSLIDSGYMTRDKNGYAYQRIK
jgi:hypothetical protein